MFVAWDQRKLIQCGFLAFGASLAGFALAREAIGAFTVGFVLGFFYFGTTTAMSTIFQGRARDEERGRLMSLWFVAFGGTVAIGPLIFGPIMDAVGARWVLLIGAAWSVVPGVVVQPAAARPATWPGGRRPSARARPRDCL